MSFNDMALGVRNTFESVRDSTLGIPLGKTRSELEGISRRNRIYATGFTIAAFLSPEFLGVSSEQSTAVSAGLAVYAGLKSIQASQRIAP